MQMGYEKIEIFDNISFCLGNDTRSGRRLATYQSFRVVSFSMTLNDR